MPGPPTRPGTDPAGSGRSGEIWAATPPATRNCQLLSIALQAAWRLQGLQVAEVVFADRLQTLGKGGLLEIIGQVICNRPEA